MLSGRTLFKFSLLDLFSVFLIIAKKLVHGFSYIPDFTPAVPTAASKAHKSHTNKHQQTTTKNILSSRASHDMGNSNNEHENEHEQQKDVGNLSQLHGAVLYEIFHFLSFKHLLTSICLVCREWKTIVNECCQDVIIYNTPVISVHRDNNKKNWTTSMSSMTAMTSTSTSTSTSTRTNMERDEKSGKQEEQEKAQQNNNNDNNKNGMFYNGEMVVAVAEQFRLRSLVVGKLEHLFDLNHLIRVCTIGEASANNNNNYKRISGSEQYSGDGDNNVDNDNGDNIDNDDHDNSSYLQTVRLLRCSLQRKFEVIDSPSSSSSSPSTTTSGTSGSASSAKRRTSHFKGLFSLFFRSSALQEAFNEYNQTTKKENGKTVQWKWIEPKFDPQLRIQIQHLEIVESKIEQSDLQSLLDRMPRLKSLKLKHCFQVKSLNIHLNHQLEHLSIDSSGCGTMETSISPQVANRLQTVSLVRTRGTVPEHYLQVFSQEMSPNLQKLTIDLCFPDEASIGSLVCACTDLTLTQVNYNVMQPMVNVIACINKYFVNVEKLCLVNVTGHTGQFSLPRLTSFQSSGSIINLSVDSVMKLNSLTLLDIASNTHESQNLSALLEYVPRELQSIRIERTKVPQHIISIVCSKFDMLSSLTLSMCGSINLDIRLFRGLKHLNLSYNSLIVDSELREIVQCNPLLEYLNLKMCGGIKNCPIEAPNLKQLLLTRTSVTDADVHELMQHCPTLQRLDINCCPNLISPVLRSHSLMYLDLSENEFVKERSIVPTIEHISHLRVLIARWCPGMFTHDSTEQFYRAFKNLSLLDVVGSVGKEDAAGELRRKLKENDRDFELIAVEQVMVSNAKLAKKFTFQSPS